MSLLNKIKTKSKFEIFLIFAIFASLSILICSCLKYIFFGSVNFDEPLDKLGLYQHVEFAGDILKGKNSSDPYSLMRTIDQLRIELLPAAKLIAKGNQEDIKEVIRFFKDMMKISTPALVLLQLLIILH